VGEELMRKVLQIIEHIIERISDLGLVSSGILILVMSLLSTYGVGRRYLLHSPEPYSYELSTMLLVACVVIAVAGLQRHRRHLRVDFVAVFLPERVQSILINIVTPVLALFYVGIVTWKGWDSALYSMRIGETSQSSWEEPLFPIKLLVPLGMALLCLVLVAQLSRGIASLIQIIKNKQR
jgi:TRAP-type mannitol/chloroaromatic compound transport system permease small subunit